MEEQYYLIPKEKLDLIVNQLDALSILNNCGLTDDKAKELSKSTLIDLSDSAIKEETNRYEANELLNYNIRYREAGKKDFSAALKNLKNKLNENN